ncbi:MAG: formimidoylglutamase [Bacteroidales bacterium]|jgi:arginase family enzyme|nr:formimidoylglutamase [Bacteroidales bacterium]
MNISQFFTPVNFKTIDIAPSERDKQMLINKVIFTDSEKEPNFNGISIAIMGVPESRNSKEKSASYLAPDEIRRQFYRLYYWEKEVNIIDLGNIIIGKTVEDTYTLVAEVVALLIDAKIIPIILGGSNDISYACYKAYEHLQQIVNIAYVSPCFNIGHEKEPLKSDAFLNKIILQQPNYLLNYANIGYQTYLNSPDSIKLMDKLFFEAHRVGVVRQNIEDIEPVVRSAEMFSMDIAAVRRSDAPGNARSSANGFYGEEICKVAFFAGMNDNLTSFGLYEYDPTLDFNQQTAQLISHILWYFIEGFIHRQNDLSFIDINLYRKHTVTVSESTKELVFYNSKLTDRWWVEIPVYNIQTQAEQKFCLPCSKTDFDQACKDQIPDRWWKGFQRFNR